MADDYQRVEVLLVEDNPTDAELCVRALRSAHVVNHLVWVQNGAQALDFLLRRGVYEGNNSKPKLVLLDLKLPKVDGLEVLRQMRADEKLKLLPVVVLTSSQEERDLIESYKNGANSYVSKPVEFDAFTNAVVQVGLYWLLINKPPPV